MKLIKPRDLNRGFTRLYGICYHSIELGVPLEHMAQWKWPWQAMVQIPLPMKCQASFCHASSVHQAVMGTWWNEKCWYRSSICYRLCVKCSRKGGVSSNSKQVTVKSWEWCAMMITTIAPSPAVADSIGYTWMPALMHSSENFIQF